ncbi:MAG TPA: hypothetical protein VHP32_10195 [Ignavibacteria bacterium]|nr:hypothetical protein [Ignavibacteria bacterium]
MKTLLFSLLLTIISLVGIKSSFATQYIYEYRDLGNDTTMILTYEEQDMTLVDVEIVENP